ncbi:MAG: serine protein kinase RIO, partial [Desulfurococcales archaeon]|nr:serine protein kinase RIO [Desulfurococcales archaeon]
NYSLMNEAGVSVPKPITQLENVLVMEFIGEKGKRAPLLKEVELSDEEYYEIFKNLIKDVRKMYQVAGLVHGDLSEYNVMIWKGRHYIIDVSQAVKVTHPNAHEFLVRDLRNIRRFFADEIGLDIPSLEELYNYVISDTDSLAGIDEL